MVPKLFFMWLLFVHGAYAAMPLCMTPRWRTHFFPSSAPPSQRKCLSVDVPEGLAATFLSRPDLLAAYRRRPLLSKIFHRKCLIAYQVEEMDGSVGTTVFEKPLKYLNLTLHEVQWLSCPPSLMEKADERVKAYFEGLLREDDVCLLLELLQCAFSEACERALCEVVGSEILR